LESTDWVLGSFLSLKADGKEHVNGVLKTALKMGKRGRITY
jgi:hypothetical protein